MNFTATPLPKPCRNLIPIQSILKETTSSTDKQNSQKDQQISSKPMQKPKEMVKKQEQTKQKNLPKGNIIHVSNISSKLTYEQIKKGLYNLFAVHGPIFQIIIKTKQSGQHFAFIDFPDIKDAEKAVNAAKTEGKKLQNKLLVVNYCEDPKKNEARKDQKCFLCHSNGHKAIRCPVKPEMIKTKQKKPEESEQETNYIEVPTKPVLKKMEPVQEKYGKQNESQESESSSDQQPKQRDKDYLRFLKLKKKLLEKKLQRKIKKSKKKKN